MSVLAARALWIVDEGKTALRDAPLPAVDAGAVLVRTLFSGISRGTEALVLAGRVPEAERARMRCPFQDGEFPFPVKYGYAAVGRVEQGPAELLGREVFCLYPHQDHFVVPVEAVRPLPAALPAARAVLAANMETALNVVWDAEIAPGESVCVVGAGVVGALSAYLAARLADAEVVLVDIDPSRASLAEALGLAFATPEIAPRGRAKLIHASGSPAGLATALDCAGFEATVIEASWYGDKPVPVPLGGAFHSQRLKLVSSQVGSVAAPMRSRFGYAQRMARALELLADPALDVLISGETAFEDLARDYSRVLGSPGVLCHRIRY